MGMFFALLTAVMWAAAIIFLKRSGETIPPFALNVFRVGFSSVLLVPTVIFAGQDIFYPAPLRDYLILFASGAG
jgi:drug/metabolite transporter (DMT)-like permease